MAKTIGKFAVNIGAVTTGFSKGIKSSSKQSQGFSKSLGSMAVKAAGVVAAFLVAKKVIGAVGAQFGAVDEIAKFASQTGIATESLVAFGHAGELSGVSGETVNKALQRMTRNMGEAQAGSKTAAKGFEMIGLSADQLSQMSPEEQFGAIADKLKAIKDPAERAAASYAIFGRAGQDMIPMLAGGSEAMAAARKEAEDLGLTFSAVDAAKIEQSNDAWTRVKGAISGVVRMFAIHLAPLFTEIGTKFTEMAKAIIAKVKSWAPVFQQFVSVVTAYFQAMVSLWSAIFSTVFGAISGSVGDMKTKIIDALIIAQFMFQNLGTVMELAWINAQVSVIAFAGSVTHFFTGVLPALFNWFGKNWTDIWHTALDFVLTGFINLGQNVRNIFSGIWTFMKTGEWEVAFVPLTEGFRNMVKELPKIPKREIGKLESNLRKEASGIQLKLGSDFVAFRDKRREELLGGGDGAEIKKPEFAVAALGADAKADGGVKAAGGTAALQRGSAAAFSAISKQIRGASAAKREKENAEAAKREKENAEANKRTAEATQAMADKFNNPEPLTLVSF